MIFQQALENTGTVAARVLLLLGLLVCPASAGAETHENDYAVSVHAFTGDIPAGKAIPDRDALTPVTIGQRISAGTWLKIKLERPVDHKTQLVFAVPRQGVEKATLFLPPDFHPLTLSAYNPPERRGFSSRYFVIPSPVAVNEGQPIYLHLAEGRLDNFSHILPPLALLEIDSRDRDLISFSRGVMSFGVLMGLLMLFRLRERIYGIFAAFSMSAIFMLMTRDGSLFDTSVGRLLAPYGDDIFGLSLVLYAGSALYFCQSLARQDLYCPRFARFGYFLLGWLVIGLVAASVGDTVHELARLFLNLAFLAALIQIIVSNIAAYMHGSKYAIFVLISQLPLVPASGLMLLVALGLTSAGDQSYRWLPVGLAFQVLIFTVGIANRALQFKSERDRAILQANRDKLTGALNRRAMTSAFQEIEETGHTSEADIYFALIDIDHFKAVNDTHGHEAGDVCLKAMSVTVQQVLRQDDRFYRFGGEEFLAILQCSTPATARDVCERIRQAVEEQTIDTGTVQLSLTISWTLTSRPRTPWRAPMRRFISPKRMGAIGPPLPAPSPPDRVTSPNDLAGTG